MSLLNLSIRSILGIYLLFFRIISIENWIVLYFLIILVSLLVIEILVSLHYSLFEKQMIEAQISFRLDSCV